MTSVSSRWLQRMREQNRPVEAPDEPGGRAEDRPTTIGAQETADDTEISRAVDDPPSDAGAPAGPDAVAEAASGGDVVPTDRSAVIGRGLQAAAAWSLRVIVVGAALFLLFWLLSLVWVGVRPIVLALIVSTVLYPPAAWLRRHRWPAGLAAAVVLVTALLLAGGLFTFAAQPIVTQSVDLANSAAARLQRLPPTAQCAPAGCWLGCRPSPRRW